MLDNVAPADVERLITSFRGVANGLVVGNYPVLIRELKKRSSFSKRTIELLIGLCAIYWGRSLLEDLELDFSDEATVIFSRGEPTLRVSLKSWDLYQAVTNNATRLGSEWLYSLAKTYSTEYAEVLGMMPIVGDAKLSDPVITVE